ncbi:ATP-binding protein [Streptomyces sp. NPDC001941]|uniref:ATP-binding protein n=1 Tax=Streptomyces sp. NPDC001941 TaxID=3154659 RepID=UPI00332E3856
MNPRAFLARLPFRYRLAVAISGLFLVSGVALLAFVVVLARYGTAQQVQSMDVRYVTTPPAAEGPYSPVAPAEPGGSGRAEPSVPPVPRGDVALVQKIDHTIQAVQDAALRQMLLWSGVGLVVMALLAGVLGWWLAGRALRPVTSVTEAARRISDENLHQRLALTGPDDELHRLADTFDTMLERLEKSFESQRRFVANASHELKTPLAVQRTSLQVGFADPLPADLAEVRDELLASNRDATRMVEALLLLARSDRGLEESGPVDLVATARQVTADQAARADEAGVAVAVAEGAPLTVLGDPLLLRHLLSNLVDNAVRYNHEGGRVDVTFEGRTVTVTNTGPRVPAERVPGLFEPFRRLDGDRTGTSGHGLGLSIAASIARAHDAELTAVPGPAGGLAIALRFP